MAGVPVEADDPRCPNCGASNPPGTAVCLGCGINLLAYRSLHPKIEQATESLAQVHQVELESETARSIASHQAGDRKRLVRNVKFAAIFLGILGLVVAAGFGLSAYKEHQRQERLQQTYLQAERCAAVEDYRCAVEGFQSVLAEEPQYPGARGQLASARRALAAQYSYAGLWREAVDELEATLRVDPASATTREQLHDTYERWYEDSVAKGDWWNAIWLKEQLLIRFR